MMLSYCGASAEIGIGLTACGLLFTLLGVALFFDGALLAVGNVRAHFVHVSFCIDKICATPPIYERKIALYKQCITVQRDLC